MAHYTWSASVVIPGQGLHDARGAFRVTGTATEDELKAAVARDVGARHNCAPGEIYVAEFTYTEVPV